MGTEEAPQKPMRIEDFLVGRHQSIQIARWWFNYDHLPPYLVGVSKAFHDLACQLIGNLNDGAELTAALRKLRESKDAAVLQRVIDHLGPLSTPTEDPTKPRP